jgi:hypothetical protein
MEDGLSCRRRTLACANLINSARCAFQMGRLSLSAALATRAIDLNPTNPAAFYVRGRARLAIPFLDLAKEVCSPHDSLQSLPPLKHFFPSTVISVCGPALPSLRPHTLEA